MDVVIRHDLFWAVDPNGRCLLVLRHGTGNAPTGPLPELTGLELARHEDAMPGRSMLVLRLKDAGLRDVFLQLCLDIAATVRTASGERDAVGGFVSRTWRWHELLRRRPSTALGHEAQMGLIGELRLLAGVLAPRLGAAAAVAAWAGPGGAPKDFEVGPVCVEAKSFGGAGIPASGSRPRTSST